MKNSGAKDRALDTRQPEPKYLYLLILIVYTLASDLREHLDHQEAAATDNSVEDFHLHYDGDDEPPPQTRSAATCQPFRPHASCRSRWHNDPIVSAATSSNQQIPTRVQIPHESHHRDHSGQGGGGSSPSFCRSNRNDDQEASNESQENYHCASSGCCCECDHPPTTQTPMISQSRATLLPPAPSGGVHYDKVEPKVDLVARAGCCCRRCCKTRPRHGRAAAVLTTNPRRQQRRARARKWSSMWSIIGLAEAIRLVRLDAPHSIPAGQPIKLRCLYETGRGGEKLQSLAWYRNGREFYRFQPFERRQPVLAFNSTGIHVDLARSRNNTVILTNTTLETSGRFRCEATGTTFQEAKLETYIEVSPASSSSSNSMTTSSWVVAHGRWLTPMLIALNLIIARSLFDRT